MRPQVLWVEDNTGDVRLIQETFRTVNSSVPLYVASDGVEAVAFLRHEGANADAPRPDLVLLDLNLPKMGGFDVRKLIKEDMNLKTIPTVILSSSESEADVKRSYQLQANGYLCKPALLDEFDDTVKSINDFWLKKAKLPR